MQIINPLPKAVRRYREPARWSPSSPRYFLAIAHIERNVERAADLINTAMAKRARGGDAESTMTPEDLKTVHRRLCMKQYAVTCGHSLGRDVSSTSKAELVKKINRRMDVRQRRSAFRTARSIREHPSFELRDRSNIERFLTIVRVSNDVKNIVSMIGNSVSERLNGERNPRGGSGGFGMTLSDLNVVYARLNEPREAVGRMAATWNLNCPIEIVLPKQRPRGHGGVALDPTHWGGKLITALDEIAELCSDHDLVIERLRGAIRAQYGRESGSGRRG